MLVSQFKQGVNQCAGVSIAAIKEFNSNQTAVDHSNKDVIAKRIRDDGQKYYELVIFNGTDVYGNYQFGDFIELSSIFHRRTLDHFNEIDLNGTVKMQFQTAYSIVKAREERIEPMLTSYF